MEPSQKRNDDLERPKRGLNRREAVRAGALVGGAAALGGAGLVTSRTVATISDPAGESTRRFLDGAHRISPGALIEFPHPGRVSL